MADLVVRAVLIVGFLITAGFLQWTQPPAVGIVIELMSQSLLNACYCFEYKTASASINTSIGYRVFEQQWVYHMGFGFPITLGLFMTKHLGSSIFFLVFPVITVMAMDEEGQGLLIMREERRANF